ncbi:MAG: sigma-54-dependent Fis family transcriptional regulator [Pirellulaceae bacterium]|nr:sigma-54-dependent Fis family transcriptional regulator [Pirellulaceae bacterium]
MIADDEPLFAMTTAQFLQERGYNVIYREDGERVSDDVAQGDVDVVIADLDMPGNRNLELLNRCRIEHPHVPFIIVTGRPSLPSAIEGIRLGIHDYLLKPLDLDDLLHSICRALPSNRMPEQNDAAFSEILGTSAAVTQLKLVAQRIAQSQATVLIRGESGTGKELLARAIHGRSRRRDGPFVTVDCTSIPESLMESVLFGHTKGAFTGADRDRTGLIMLANQGTLFLDEIGELPLFLQSKLLRVLQFGSFVPVGAEMESKVDIRILAATHRDLLKEVQSGTFRMDLFYRLSVLEIVSPPLRDRTEDIPQLAKQFLATIARRDNAPLCALTAEAEVELANYAWPGNIRELQNAMERCACLAGTNWITAEDIKANIHRSAGVASQCSAATRSLQDFRDFREREYLEELLQRHGGNIAQAAKEANLSRQGLHKALNRLGVSASTFR